MIASEVNRLLCKRGEDGMRLWRWFIRTFFNKRGYQDTHGAYGKRGSCGKRGAR